MYDIPLKKNSSFFFIWNKKQKQIITKADEKNSGYNKSFKITLYGLF